MRPHISLDVRDVAKSVAFYEKVFGVKPQKQVSDYAKFDLKTPALNFSLVSSTGEVSAVDHLGIEVETVEEIAEWKSYLQHEGILERVEDNIACCFARQDKLWFTDQDGNAWEIFTVHEQLETSGRLSQTGCCVPKTAGAHESATCGARLVQYRMEIEEEAVMTTKTEELWQLMHDGLRAFIVKRVDDQEHADDILQEVSVRVHRQIDSVKDPERLVS